MQLTLYVRKIRMRNDTPFISNLRTRFETLDSSLQRGAIGDPPNEDDERRNKRDQEPPCNGRSMGDAVVESEEYDPSPEACQVNPRCCHCAPLMAPVPFDAY